MFKKAILICKKLKDKNPTENIILTFIKHFKEKGKKLSKKNELFFTDEINPECYVLFNVHTCTSIAVY